MLKTLGNTESKTQPGESGVGVSSSSRVKNDKSGSRINDNEVDSSEVGDNGIEKNIKKLPKYKNLSKFQKAVRSDFLTPGASLAFTKLRQTFVKSLILYHFDLKCHIRIETDVFGYAISKVLSQLALDDLGQWYPVAFFSQKIIPAKTRYETHNAELLAIVKAFKTWRHYLEGSQYEVLVLTDHNNLRQFIDTKSLSSKQVRWAQELSCYHFCINYCQGKANGATDTLSQYPQQSTKEEKTLRTKNIKILHHLQSLLTKVSGFLASQPSQLSSLHQIFICGTTVFL